MEKKVLILHSNKKQTFFAIFILSYSLALFIMLSKKNVIASVSGQYLTPYIQFIFALLIAIYIPSIFYGCYVLIKKTPAAMLSDTGIWVNHYGFLAWSDVAQFKETSPYGVPATYIGIKAKSFSKLFSQSAFIAKSGLLIAKICSLPHIMLANLNVPNECIVSFARCYLNK